jgi:hypothetical protein
MPAPFPAAVLSTARGMQLSYSRRATLSPAITPLAILTGWSPSNEQAMSYPQAAKWKNKRLLWKKAYNYPQMGKNWRPLGLDRTSHTTMFHIMAIDEHIAAYN